MDLEWKRCPISGQLRAEGKRGTYWIDEQAWTYLSKVGINEQGPFIGQLGQFYDVKEAKKVAEHLNSME